MSPRTSGGEGRRCGNHRAGPPRGDIALAECRGRETRPTTADEDYGTAAATDVVRGVSPRMSSGERERRPAAVASVLAAAAAAAGGQTRGDAAADKWREIGDPRRWLRRHVAADELQGGGGRGLPTCLRPRDGRGDQRLAQMQMVTERRRCGQAAGRGGAWTATANKAAGRLQPQNQKIRAKSKGATERKASW